MKEHVSVITRKGQITIPAEIRKALDLNEGDLVTWTQDGESVRISPTRYTLESAFGSVEPATETAELDRLINEAKEERTERRVRSRRHP